MFDKDFLTKKLDKFVALLSLNADVDYEFEETEDFYIVKVFFRGENVGYAIGNRGEKINSMQNILLMMLRQSLRTEKKEDEEKVSKLRVFVDIGDYREKKKGFLMREVHRKVEDARVLGEPVDLNPMSALERREVHMELQKFDDVKTESVGEGRERFVRIIPISEGELGVISDDEEKEEQEE